MTPVITESCIGCRYSDCVAVCPGDGFHVGPNVLVIDPIECIDCGKCIPECPCSAIFAEEDLPTDQRHMTAINAELSIVFPVITETLNALPDAEEWKTTTAKFEFLRRE